MRVMVGEGCDRYYTLMYCMHDAATCQHVCGRGWDRSKCVSQTAQNGQRLKRK